MELLSADPFDPEVQARIAERIRQAQVRDGSKHVQGSFPGEGIPAVMLC